MKKTLLLFSVLSLSLAQSQTITVDDTLATGDLAYYYAADTGVANLNGVTGAGVTWDYSALSYTNEAGAMVSKDTVIDIATSTYSSDYPAADYHENLTGGVQSFISHTPDSTMTHGFVFENSSSEYIIRYNIDPLTSAKFPMVVGTTYTDLISGDAVLPSVPGATALSGSATINADGSGTLNLGVNSYTDVIRVKTIESLSGSIPFIGAVLVTRTSYIYYSQSTSNMPVFIHGEIFADLGSFGTINLKSIWSKDMLSGYAGVDQNLTVVNPELSVYPNPARTNVTIKSNNTSELIIYNAVGKEIISIKNPSHSEEVDLSHLTAGIYFVQVKNEQQLITKKLVIK